jgi:hypothetical protein
MTRPPFTFVPGYEPALPAVPGKSVSETVRSLVLQKGLGIHNVGDSPPFHRVECLNRSLSNRKKRENKIKRDVKRGIREPNEQDPFEIFVTVTNIRYT